MTFEETLREKIKKATFGSKEKGILKVVLGDIQQIKGKVTDPICWNLVDKLIAGNNAVLPHLTETDSRWADLREENRVLAELLPAFLTAEEIENSLQEIAEAIKTAKDAGKATGLAIGLLSKQKAIVRGDTVKQVVKRLRGEE